MKTCGTCKQELSFDHFHSRKASRDGHCAKCKKCQKEYHSRYFQENRAHLLKNHNTRRREYRKSEEYREKERVANRVYDRNRRAKQYAYREVNKGRILAKEREAFRKRYAKDPAKYKAKVRLRYATKCLATPTWLSEEHKYEMYLFYKNCPKGHDVDHIVPLVSEVVQGLHVPWNLQYLPASENRRKGNSLPTQSA